MSPLKATWRYCFVALAVFVILDLGWQVVGQAYGRAYRTTGEALFGNFGSSGVVRFKPSASPHGFLDTDIVLGKRGVDATIDGKQSSLVIAYLPTIELAALVLAAPIGWSRKWRALLWGLVLIHAFVALRLLITLLDQFSQPSSVRLFDPGATVGRVLSEARAVLCVSPTFSFVAPVLIALLVSLRSEDIARARALLAHCEPKAKPTKG